MTAGSKAKGAAAAAPRPRGGDEGRDAGLPAVQAALLRELDGTIDRLERARMGESTREHLEILRDLLKAQVTTYLGHFVTPRETPFPRTPAAPADEAAPAAVAPATLRSLLAAHTLTTGQAGNLAHIVADRRTLLIVGDRDTDGSALLNALFELVSLDERFVAVERDPALPALRERAFCVRLTARDDTDIEALFAKARRMGPSRLVVDDMHAGDMKGFFAILSEDSAIAGMATLRAEGAASVGTAVEAIVAAIGGDTAAARRLVATARPVFAHLRLDATGAPRLTGIWSATGLKNGEVELTEIPTDAPSTPAG